MTVLLNKLLYYKLSTPQWITKPLVSVQCLLIRDIHGVLCVQLRLGGENPSIDHL